MYHKIVLGAGGCSSAFGNGQLTLAHAHKCPSPGRLPTNFPGMSAESLPRRVRRAIGRGRHGDAAAVASRLGSPSVRHLRAHARSDPMLNLDRHVADVGADRREIKSGSVLPSNVQNVESVFLCQPLNSPVADHARCLCDHFRVVVDGHGFASFIPAR